MQCMLRIARLLGDIEPQNLTEALLREIAERYPENLSEDDVTVLLVRANGRPLRVTFTRKAGRAAAIFENVDRVD